MSWVVVLGTAVLGASEIEAAQLTLDWVDTAGGQASFSIERKASPTGTYAAIAQQPPGATSYVDAGVDAGAAYCYRVRAFNDGGMSDYSNEACASLPAGFDLDVVIGGTGAGGVVSSPAGISCRPACSASYPGGTVVTLVATAAPGAVFSGWSGAGCGGTAPCALAGNGSALVSASFATLPSQLTLNWIDTARGQASFAIERKTGPTGTYTAIAQQPPGATSYADASVDAGTAYCYRVRAFNAAGMSDYSNEACASPSPPPTTPATQLTLSWVDTAGGQASFTIERKTGPTGTYAAIAQQPPGATSYVDAGVAAGTAYCYRVRAFNAAGVSDYSNEACAGLTAGFDMDRVIGGTGRVAMR